MKSIWIGDKANGIELRPEGKTKTGMLILDELLIYQNGVCILHIESMSPSHHFVGIGLPGLPRLVATYQATHGRAAVQLTAETPTEAPRD